MKKYSYKILTNDISSKDICNKINSSHVQHDDVECYNFEGSRFYIRTHASPKHLHDKLEKLLEVKLAKYEDID